MTASIRASSALIATMDENAKSQEAEVGRLRRSIKAERDAVAGVLEAIGAPSVLPTSAALEQSADLCAPILCPALGRMGSVAKAALPALKRVAAATTGETSRLAIRAMARILGDKDNDAR